MSYKTMKRKPKIYIRKAQKLTSMRPEKRMLNFLSLLKITVIKLKNCGLDLYNSFDFLSQEI